MNDWFKIENKNGESILVECSKEACGDVVVPDSVTRIAENAFKGVSLIGGKKFIGRFILTAIE